MTADRRAERGWVCAGCGYALIGLDQAALCPECGGQERRDTRVRRIRRAWSPRAVTALALGPSAFLVAAVLIGPSFDALVAVIRWCGSGAMLLLGTVAILHGVSVGAVALDSGQLEVRRGVCLADGVIFLAPLVVLVDLAVFGFLWLVVVAHGT